MQVILDIHGKIPIFQDFFYGFPEPGHFPGISRPGNVEF